MPAIVNKLGPGTLTVGETGTAVDFTCQVTAARVEWTADAEDDVEVLCGESVPGARTYSAVLSGTIFNDLGTTAGHRGVLLDQQGHHPAVRVPAVHDHRREAGHGRSDHRPDQHRRRRGRPEHDQRLRVGVRRRPGPRGARGTRPASRRPPDVAVNVGVEVQGGRELRKIAQGRRGRPQGPDRRPQRGRPGRGRGGDHAGTHALRARSRARSGARVPSRPRPCARAARGCPTPASRSTAGRRTTSPGSRSSCPPPTTPSRPGCPPTRRPSTSCSRR